MCACWNNHNRTDGGIEAVAVDAEGHSPFTDVKNFIFCMEVRRCCCAWRRDIFHNCIAAIHLCSVNPNAQLFSGNCLKPFDGVMVTDNRCTLFECMIRSKLRAELVGNIHQNFSFMKFSFSYLGLKHLNLNAISQGRYQWLRSLRASPSSSDIWQLQRRAAACPQAAGVRASAQPRRASLSSGRSCRVLLASREVQSSVSKRCSVTRALRCRESHGLPLVEWWTIPVADRSPDRPLAILQARRRLQAQRGCEEGSQLLGAGCL